MWIGGLSDAAASQSEQKRAKAEAEKNHTFLPDRGMSRVGEAVARDTTGSQGGAWLQALGRGSVVALGVDVARRFDAARRKHVALDRVWVVASFLRRIPIAAHGRESNKTQ